MVVESQTHDFATVFHGTPPCPRDDEPPVFRPQFGRAKKIRFGTTNNAFRNAVLANVRAGSRLARSLRPAKMRVAVRAPTALSRRVVLKARVVQMKASGLKGAALHLRYIQREGVERDGSKGNLYVPTRRTAPLTGG